MKEALVAGSNSRSILCSYNYYSRKVLPAQLSATIVIITVIVIIVVRMNVKLEI
jgi:hypothetical protein